MVVDRILCPIDFSKCSGHALEHAAALARRYESRLTVLHVVPPMMNLPLSALPADLRLGAELSTAEDPAIADDVSRFCGSLLAMPDGQVTVDVKHGDVAKTIVERASSHDLIVMAPHARHGVERLMVGSVTDKVLRMTPVPVLTVPPPVGSSASVRYHMILCPIEFSGTSARAVSYALSMAADTGARVMLLHVIGGYTGPPAFGELCIAARTFDEYIEQTAVERLKAVVPDKARGWCPTDHRVAHGRPYKQIVNVAVEEGAEVIVMGVHPRTVLHPHVFGSTTPRVIREAHCPVITLRADARPPVSGWQ